MKELLRLDKERAANLLNFLADGVREGHFTIRAGVRHFSFVRSSIPLLRIKASRKPLNSRKCREKIKIVLSWKEAPSPFLRDVQTQGAGSVSEEYLRPASDSKIGHHDEKVLDFLFYKKPHGASLIELGEGIGENWRKLTVVVFRLIGEGKIQKEGKLYRAVIGSKRGFGVLGH